MNKASSSSRSRLLLTEIIIAIFFFSLASAICLRLFFKAHTLSQDTRELDMAVRQASSAADLFSQSERPAETLLKIYPDAWVNGMQASVYFDQDFQPCQSKDSCYTLAIIPLSAKERISVYSIAVWRMMDFTKIYSLEVTAYRPYIPREGS